jgi:mono/diheme cytochrome c family protein
MDKGFVKYVYFTALGFLLTGFFVSPLWGEENDPKQGKAKYLAVGCDSCHGKSGRGDGPAAVALNPKPPDFCGSTKHPANAQKIKMITRGGANMGHSSLMPPYDGMLGKQAILDIVAYINSLCKK